MFSVFQGRGINMSTTYVTNLVVMKLHTDGVPPGWNLVATLCNRFSGNHFTGSTQGKQLVLELFKQAPVTIATLATLSVIDKKISISFL